MRGCILTHKKAIPIVVVLLLAVLGMWVTLHGVNDNAASWHNQSAFATQPYRIHLETGTSYVAGRPANVQFTVRGQNDGVVRNFATSGQYNLMLTVIRSDRTDFQHVHPAYDSKLGIFSVPNLLFPENGLYRLLAQFSVANDSKNEFVAYTDVTVGNTPQVQTPPGASDKFVSNANGFETSIIFSSASDSPSVPRTTFTAGRDASMVVGIHKNSAPFTNSQSYKGSLGRIFAFGPNLVFMAANAQPTIRNEPQSGILVFILTFPTSGKYKLFMQTEAGSQFSTFDYAVTVTTPMM